jgi:hypothetical protein
MGEGSIAWVLKALLAGCISYIAQQCLKAAHLRLHKLQAKPLETHESLPAVNGSSLSDEDLEELLTHLCDRYMDSGDLSVKENLQIIFTVWVVIPITHRYSVVIRASSKGKVDGT